MSEDLYSSRMGKSSAKILRSKRKLLTFLLKKRMEGDVIKINLMTFMSNIKKEVSIQDSLINCRKHSEQRLVSLIGTVQHSSYTSKIEKDFMSDLKINHQVNSWCRRGSLHT